ncbi:MAG TPA: hypothetical protein VM820_08750 [Vicinamibacterales bacterium]|nr:hypothetical protein [Vicinamibacterales bacterium]
MTNAIGVVGRPKPSYREGFERARQAVEGRESLLRLEAEKPDVLVEFMAMYHLPERRVLRDLVADDDQLQARWSARAWRA